MCILPSITHKKIRRLHAPSGNVSFRPPGILVPRVYIVCTQSEQASGFPANANNEKDNNTTTTCKNHKHDSCIHLCNVITN